MAAGRRPKRLTSRVYAKGLDAGMRGDPEGWRTVWESLSRGRKTYQQEKWPGNYPEHYADLYSKSLHHTVKLMAQEGGNTWTIVSEVGEATPRSNLHGWFMPDRRGADIASFYNNFPDAERVVASVVEDLRSCYEFPSDKEPIIIDYFKKLNVAELTSGFLFNDMSDRFNLKQRATAQASVVVYVRQISLVEEDGSWKIDRNVIKSRFLHKW